MDDELVSVVIPTYNRAYCICRAIESVRLQTHEKWELILIDDGSTDETAGVITSRYGHDPRVRYIYQDNSGVCAARNRGIRASRGNYVALLDSDDEWKPWKLKAQLACFRAFPEVGMVWTEFEARDSAGRLVSPKYLRQMYHAYRFFPSPASLFSSTHKMSPMEREGWEDVPDVTVHIGNIYRSMLRGNLVHTSTVVLSRERIDKVKGFDESLVLAGEDYDFHFRTCRWGSVCFIDAASTIYQLQFDDQLSRHKLHVAVNFLKTVETAIAREGGTSHFPEATVHEVLAEGHGWIAEEQLKRMDRAAIRHHALLSLRHRPWQPRRIALLSLSMLPSPCTQALLRSYRALRRFIKRQPQDRPTRSFGTPK